MTEYHGNKGTSMTWLLGATIMGSIGSSILFGHKDSGEAIPSFSIPARKAHCEIVLKDNSAQISKAFIRAANGGYAVYESAPQGAPDKLQDSFSRVDPTTLRTVAINSNTGEALGSFDVVTKDNGKQFCVVTEGVQSRLVYSVMTGPAR